MASWVDDKMAGLAFNHEAPPSIGLRYLMQRDRPYMLPDSVKEKQI